MAVDTSPAEEIHEGLVMLITPLQIVISKVQQVQTPGHLWKQSDPAMAPESLNTSTSLVDIRQVWIVARADGTIQVLDSECGMFVVHLSG